MNAARLHETDGDHGGVQGTIYTKDQHCCLVQFILGGILSATGLVSPLIQEASSNQLEGSCRLHAGVCGSVLTESLGPLVGV